MKFEGIWKMISHWSWNETFWEENEIKRKLKIKEKSKVKWSNGKWKRNEK